MQRILATSLLLAFFGFASAQTTVQLILDASGSMFKTLEDGRYRITAAKDVLADMVSALPSARDLVVGLRVYGAQTDALADEACTDSQLVVPMTGFDREALLGAIRGTQARGATPIAYSLDLALQDFASVAGDKLLVLVTDGEESCGGDVRALARRFVDAGIDLRVIGFDLSDRAAASFEGVGAFEHARSAAELAQALGRAVEPVGPAAPEPLSVTVRLTRDGEPAEGAGVTLVSAVTGEETRLTLREAGVLEGAVPAGTYRAVLEDALTDSPQTASDIHVTPEAENAFEFALAAAADVAVTVSPEEPVAGSRVTVTYAGAPTDGTIWTTIVPPSAPDDVARVWTHVQGADGSVELATPPEPGELQARVLVEVPEGGTRVVGRSEPFRTVAADVSLDVPSEAVGGSRLEIAWTGPSNDDDFVTIVPAGSPQGAYASWAYTANGNPLALSVPLEPGAYEVRYVAGQGETPTLASVPLEVTGADYGVQAPDRVPVRTAFAVSWTGPDNAGDFITIVPLGAPEGAYASFAYTYEGNPVAIEAPADPGMYEVRYTTEAAPSPTLASRPIEVLGVDYTLNAPASVAAGAIFDVAWTGPDGAGDYVTIVPADAPEGAYGDYRYTEDGSPLTLTAPEAPGAYEVRYQSDNVTGVFARTPIRVE